MTWSDGLPSRPLAFFMLNPAQTYDIEVFFDGGCPLCKREVAMLRRWDRQARIRFTDIDAEGFQPESYGKSLAELMAQMHARLPDGNWIVGVEVFRRLYSATGLGWLVALTRLPILSHSLDAAYWLFAKNRLRLTGRCVGETCKVKPL